MAKEVFAGIDFGGTRLKLALVRAGQVIYEENLPAQASGGLASNLLFAKKQIDAVSSRMDIRVAGLGICFPGIVDFDRKKVLSDYVKYPDAHRMDLPQWFKENLDVPFVIENDARAALVGEWKHGAARGYNHVVCVTLGTGLGTGVLFDGKPMRGKNYLAGNLGGHQTINYEGAICNCGNIGCLESEISSWKLSDNARRSPQFNSSKLAAIEDIDYKKVFELARQGDSLACQLRDKSLKVWGLGIINLIHAYDPEIMVFSGGIMKSAEEIIPRFNEMIDKHAWINSNKIKLVTACNPDLSGIYGVYELLKINYSYEI